MIPKPLPADLQEEIAALTETGFYASEESVLTGAFATLLSARPDLRVAVACRLDAEGRFSLGRAAGWSRRSVEAPGARGVSIPAYLLLYESLGTAEGQEVSGLVTALEEKDRYGFPAEIRRRLVGDEI